MRWLVLTAVTMVAGCLSVAGPTPATPAAPVVTSESVRRPAPPPPETTQNPSVHPAGDYLLDNRHTSVTWRVRHLGLSMYTARFDNETGTLSYDPVDPARSRVSVSIDIASVSTGDVNRAGERGVFDREAAYSIAKLPPHLVWKPIPRLPLSRPPSSAPGRSRGSSTAI
jgi:hypothetical protein